MEGWEERCGRGSPRVWLGPSVFKIVLDFQVEILGRVLHI